MAKSFVLLGSNLGDRERILEKAKEEIANNTGLIIGSSSIYESEPWGFEAKNSFLNQVIIIETKLSPRQLLETALEIERGFGRKRTTGEYESREMDIDILFYEDEIINEIDLVVPHPRIQERMFALKPLMEISDDFIHPVLKLSVKELYDSCKDKLEVQIY